MRFGRTFDLRPAALLALGQLAAGCYEIHATPVRVASNPTTIDCYDTVDRVFADAGYGRVAAQTIADRFYTPLVHPTTMVAPGLGWGVAVSIEGKPANELGHCRYELQALSVDPGCGLVCSVSPPPGDGYTEIVRDLSRRLKKAFSDEQAPRDGSRE